MKRPTRLSRSFLCLVLIGCPYALQAGTGLRLVKDVPILHL